MYATMVFLKLICSCSCSVSIRCDCVNGWKYIQIHVYLCVYHPQRIIETIQWELYDGWSVYSHRHTHTQTECTLYIRLRTMTKAILLAATMFISSFASFLQFGSFFLSLLVVVLPLLLLHCYCECAVLPFSHNTHRTHGPIHGETSRRAFKRQTEIELSTLTFKLTITLHSLTIWLVGSDNCTHGSATVAPTHTHWPTHKKPVRVYIRVQWAVATFQGTYIQEIFP